MNFSRLFLDAWLLHELRIWIWVVQYFLGEREIKIISNLISTNPDNFDEILFPFWAATFCRNYANKSIEYENMFNFTTISNVNDPSSCCLRWRSDDVDIASFNKREHQTILRNKFFMCVLSFFFVSWHLFQCLLSASISEHEIKLK